MGWLSFGMLRSGLLYFSVLLVALAPGAFAQGGASPLKPNQQQRLDSLRQLIRTKYHQEGPAAGARVAFERYREVRKIDQDTALAWVKQGEQWAEREGSPGMRGYALTMRGVEAYFEYRDSLALSYFLRALPLVQTADGEIRRELYHTMRDWARANGDFTMWYEYAARSLALSDSLKNTDWQIEDRMMLAILHQEVGALDKALEITLSLTSFIDTTKASLHAAEMISLLGNVYSRIGEIDRAIACSQRILEWERQIPNPSRNDSINFAGNISNLGIQYKKKKDYAKAAYHYDQAQRYVDALRAGGNDPAYLSDLVTAIANNRGSLAYVQGQYPEAERLFKASIAQARIGKAGRQITGGLADLCELYVAWRRYPQAIAAGEEALERATRSKSLQVAERLTALLANAYAGIGQHRRAYELHVNHKGLADSLARSSQLRRISLLEKATELAARQREIDRLQLEALEASADRRNLAWGLAGAIALVLTIGFVYTNSRKTNALLREKNLEIEDKNHEITAALDELKATQEQLVKTEKLAALGTLTANVAHEMNTPLAAIRSSATHMGTQLQQLLASVPEQLRSLSDAELATLRQLVTAAETSAAETSTRDERQQRRRMQDHFAGTKWSAQASDLSIAAVDLGLLAPEALAPYAQQPHLDRLLSLAAELVRLRHSLQTIASATGRTHRVVSHLRLLSRPQLMGPREPVDLGENVTTALSAMRRTLESGYRFVQQIEPGLLVSGQSELLRQVWTNLVSNALDATGASGQVTLSLSRDNGEAVLRVHDTGPGIPAHLQERIFEPFFTTKPDGQGGGLGLYLSRIIVSEHGGRIELDSRPGDTTFTVRLPLRKALS